VPALVYASGGPWLHVHRARHPFDGLVDVPAAIMLSRLARTHARTGVEETVPFALPGAQRRQAATASASFVLDLGRDLACLAPFQVTPA
jgi:hypothetical protein